MWWCGFGRAKGWLVVGAVFVQFGINLKTHKIIFIFSVINDKVVAHRSRVAG